MVWPNDFLDIIGAADAAVEKTLTGMGGATAAPKPKPPTAAGSAAAGGPAAASGSLGLLSLRMFTKRESKADCASIIFSNDPQGGGCGGWIFIICAARCCKRDSACPDFIDLKVPVAK